MHPLAVCPSSPQDTQNRTFSVFLMSGSAFRLRLYNTSLRNRVVYNLFVKVVKLRERERVGVW